MRKDGSGAEHPHSQDPQGYQNIGGPELEATSRRSDPAGLAWSTQDKRWADWEALGDRELARHVRNLADAHPTIPGRAGLVEAARRLDAVGAEPRLVRVPDSLDGLLTRLGFHTERHGPTTYTEDWWVLERPQGSVRVVVHPDDGRRVELYRLDRHGVEEWSMHWAGETPGPVQAQAIRGAIHWAGTAG